MFKLFYGTVGLMAFTTGFAAMFVSDSEMRGKLVAIAVTGVVALLLLVALDPKRSPL